MLAASFSVGAIREELNLGHLCRQIWGREAALIGFGTQGGTVACASDWDDLWRWACVGCRRQRYKRAHRRAIPIYTSNQFAECSYQALATDSTGYLYLPCSTAAGATILLIWANKQLWVSSQTGNMVTSLNVR